MDTLEKKMKVKKEMLLMDYLLLSFNHKKIININTNKY